MDWDEACRQASALVATRNYAEAEQVIYGAYNQVKAENNLEKICTSLDLLGWLCFMQAKHQQASEIYYYCAQAKVQLLGSNNIEVAKTIKNIIASTYQLKQYEKVVDMARECLRIFALHLPRENPEIATLGKNLYELLKWMNRIPEAEQIKRLYLDPPAPPAPSPVAAMQAQAQSGAYPVPQQQMQQQPQAQQHQQQQYQQAQAQSGAYPVSQQQQQQQQAQQQQQQASGAQNQWAPQPQTQSGAYATQQQNMQQQQQQQQPQPQAQSQAQPQAASQGHFRQISIPPQNQQAQQAPISASQAPVQQAPLGDPVPDSAAKAAAARRKDYSKFAKSVCEVCKQEYEGAGCLRCTSAGIKAFDPGSTFGSEW